MNRRAKLILFQQRPCVISAQFNTTGISNLEEIMIDDEANYDAL